MLLFVGVMKNLKLNNQQTTFRSTAQHHASFGIYKYLKNKGIVDNDIQSEIINSYILLAKITGSNSESKFQKIQYEFHFFAKYVNDFIKLL